MAETWINPRDGKLAIGATALEAEADARLMGDYDFEQPPDEAIGAFAMSFPELLNGPDFPINKSDIKRPIHSGWTEDDFENFCRWTVKLLSGSQDIDDSEERVLLDSDISRMGMLGLCPARLFFRQALGNLYVIRERLGQPAGTINGKYTGWTETQFADHAAVVASGLEGRKPAGKDYAAAAAAGEGPSHQTIFRLIGGIDALNELIGWPDFKTMTNEEIVVWYGRILIANDALYINKKIVNVLSSRDLSLSDRTIADRFGSMEDFKDEVYEHTRKVLKQRAELLDYFDAINPVDEHSNSLARDYTESDKIAFAAKYRVVHKLLPSSTPKSKVDNP